MCSPIRKIPSKTLQDAPIRLNPAGYIRTRENFEFIYGLYIIVRIIRHCCEKEVVSSQHVILYVVEECYPRRLEKDFGYHGVLGAERFLEQRCEYLSASLLVLLK